MALGLSRPRNWGKEAQQSALEIALLRRHVAFRTTKLRPLADGTRRLLLWLTPSRNGLTLPFTESCAELENIGRGRWQARHPVDGRLLAKGISERDVIRATIDVVWR